MRIAVRQHSAVCCVEEILNLQPYITSRLTVEEGVLVWLIWEHISTLLKSPCLWREEGCFGVYQSGLRNYKLENPEGPHIQLLGN